MTMALGLDYSLGGKKTATGIGFSVAAAGMAEADHATESGAGRSEVGDLGPKTCPHLPAYAWWLLAGESLAVSPQ